MHGRDFGPLGGVGYVGAARESLLRTSCFAVCCAPAPTASVPVTSNHWHLEPLASPMENCVVPSTDVKQRLLTGNNPLTTCHHLL